MTLAPIALQTAISLPITGVLAVIALGLRLWSRSIRRTPLAFNDYAIIAAMVIVLGVIGNALFGVFIGGVGVHIAEVEASRPGLIEVYLKASSLLSTVKQVADLSLQSFIAAQVLWSAANTCVKTSILSLYTVIFPVKNFRRICYAVIGVTAVYFVSVLVEAFSLCKPVQFNWDKKIEEGICTGQSAAYLGAAVMNLTLDLIVWILPMPMVFNLQLSLAKKLGVAAMFSLGAVICIISLLRVLWLVSWDLTDLTYGVGPGTIYSALEPILGVISACLPTIKPAIIRVTRVIFPSLADYTKSFIGRSRNTDSKTPKSTNTGAAPYQQIDDNIPLENVYAQGGDGNINENHIITVTHEWNVDTSTHTENPQQTHW